MRSPADAAVSGPAAPGPDGRPVRDWVITVAVTYSLILAAGGGLVFYASVRPVSVPAGLGAAPFGLPWVTAYLSLSAVWWASPVLLLVLGLVEG